jgi:hypothetical protein
MLINYCFDISISVSQSTPLITLLNVCDARRRDIETESAFLSTPSEPQPIATISAISAGA